MADEAREYLRAAQQAEVRGDRSQAVELLMKAATVYRQRGQNERALQMLRHASRLDVTRTDISDQVRRMEWMPDRPFLRAVTDAEEEAEEKAALQPLEDLALNPADELVDLADASQKQLIDRGPSRADPALNAWCSFCCKPKSEVGELVSGPAGAYVCLACVRESARLLGQEPETSAQLPGSQAQVVAGSGLAGKFGPEPEPGQEAGSTTRTSTLSNSTAHAPTSASSPVSARRELGPTVDPVGQEQAILEIELALRLGVDSVLLLGPEGAGKTAHLRDLERRGLGVYVETPSQLDVAPPDLPALVDHLEDATPEDWRQLAQVLRGGRAAPVLLAMRGVLPPAEVMLARDGQELPLYPTAMLAQATLGKIPPEVLERVQIAVSFQPPSREELVEVARRLAALRASELDATDELLTTVAELAMASGRLGHELRAVLGRLPAGEWSARKVNRAATEKPEKKPARRRKKTDEG
ncbi:MAG: ClpX C4-type zinc finger protein [Myxococcota bacterium]|nr:ClpX C4-type zinc finger protein [Myxococcota bacterium]